MLHINIILLVLSSTDVDAKSKVIVLIVKGFQLSSSICQSLSVNIASRFYEMFIQKACLVAGTWEWRVRWKITYNPV